MAVRQAALLTPLLLGGLALGGCAGGVLDSAGPVSAQERTILLDALGIMLAIVIPTLIATLAFAWWFRASNTRARYRPDFVYSGRVELIVWSIPIMVVLFLSGVIWIGSHALDPDRRPPSRAAPLEVQVVSLDWKWLFIYPQQGVASVNTLMLPVGVPTHFTLTSASVMNTFFVPQLGSMIYTMNGMSTRLWLQADRPGVYYGRSGHFSGDGFSDMQFEARAIAPEAFAAWAARTRGAGPILDARAYADLARQGVSRPFTYGAVEPDIYARIAAQALPPAPGPQQGRAGPQVSPRPQPEARHAG